MAIEAPPWVSPEDVAEYGAAFCCCFTSKAHWEHFKATGDMRRPDSGRHAARLAADPISAQRERLRRPVANARRAIADAEKRVAEAREHLHSLDGYKAELTIKQQTERLEERTAALRRAEVDLDLFDLLHR